MNYWGNPAALWLLLLPFAVYFLLPAAKNMYGDALKVPFVADLLKISEQSGGFSLKFRHSASVRLRLALLSLIWLLSVAALCRPQWAGEPQRIKSDGRDILLVVDISNSMSEHDFKYQNKMYDRLTAVKNVVNDFIDKRSDDRMGLVLFGTRAYMQVPLTFDKQSLKEVLWMTEPGMAGNSTSIGDALGVALKNLPPKDSVQPQNKVIVLLTDGENNDGRLSLPQAIKLAKDEGVKVYTIGVGSDSASFFGGLLNVAKDSGLDDAGLKALADETKGRYYRAKDVQSLFQVYNEIDKLEPVENEGRFIQEVKELYYYLAGAALLLFLVLVLWVRKVW